MIPTGPLALLPIWHQASSSIFLKAAILTISEPEQVPFSGGYWDSRNIQIFAMLQTSISDCIVNRLG
jgi:hypothetical protein